MPPFPCLPLNLPCMWGFHLYARSCIWLFVLLTCLLSIQLLDPWKNLERERKVSSSHTLVLKHIMSVCLKFTCNWEHAFLFAKSASPCDQVADQRQCGIAIVAGLGDLSPGSAWRWHL